MKKVQSGWTAGLEAKSENKNRKKKLNRKTHSKFIALLTSSNANTLSVQTEVSSPLCKAYNCEL